MHEGDHGKGTMGSVCAQMDRTMLHQTCKISDGYLKILRNLPLSKYITSDVIIDILSFKEFLFIITENLFFFW